MPFDTRRIHPISRELYQLAITYNSIMHPLCVVFCSEIYCEDGHGEEFLAQCYSELNERRAAAGLAPIDRRGADV